MVAVVAGLVPEMVAAWLRMVARPFFMVAGWLRVVAAAWLQAWLRGYSATMKKCRKINGRNHPATIHFHGALMAFLCQRRRLRHRDRARADR
jgi:hypothetical protein